MLMNTQDIRAEAFATPLKQEDVPTPFWPKSDGQVAITDIPTDELHELQPLSKKDQAAYIAALLCRALVNKHNGERIFADADRDMVKKFGGSMLTPVFKQVATFFGTDVEKAVAEAKKN
jgi:hypothetical protein